MGSKRRVVVTGLGVTTALGLQVSENWRKLLEGTSGIQRLSYAGSEKSSVRAAGAVTEDDWTKIKEEFPEDAIREGERRTLFALWAAKSALTDAGMLYFSGDSQRCGVVLAAGLGINRPEDIQRWADKQGTFDYIKFGREYNMVHHESLVRNNSNRPAAIIGKRFKLQGINCTVTTACASATQAIGSGYRTIQSGDADMVVAGGSDSMINPIGLIFFVLLGAASVSSEDPHAVCRPFDRKRSGLVMGEGAGITVLEEEQHAIRRGARIYAEVAGYGSSMDAYQVTAPHPHGHGAEHSMRLALKDARVNSDAIDYINAHGTSTKLNDIAETIAIKNVFQENAYHIPISSSKSMIGHLIAASGGPEFVYTVLSVFNDEIHPTINLTYPDPKCDLDYVPHEKRLKTVRTALSNSFGFGGQNASIIVKKYKQKKAA